MTQMMAIQIIRADDLEHFGIKRKSGRYKWGSGKRPFQSETPAQREARKEHAIRVARSATEINEFADELSDDELRRAINRIEMNQKLDQYTAKEKEASMAKIDAAMKKVSKINDWTSIGIKSLTNLKDILTLFDALKSLKKGDYDKAKKYADDKSKKKQVIKTPLQKTNEPKLSKEQRDRILANEVKNIKSQRNFDFKFKTKDSKDPVDQLDWLPIRSDSELEKIFNIASKQPNNRPLQDFIKLFNEKPDLFKNNRDIAGAPGAKYVIPTHIKYTILDELYPNK